MSALIAVLIFLAGGGLSHWLTRNVMKAQAETARLEALAKAALASPIIQRMP